MNVLLDLLEVRFLEVLERLQVARRTGYMDGFRGLRLREVRAVRRRGERPFIEGHARALREVPSVRPPRRQGRGPQVEAPGRLRADGGVPPV